VTLKAALSALHHDEQIWQEVATVVGNASYVADGLSLNESQLSWASHPTGLLSTYDAIRHKVSRLLDEGSQTFHGLAATLDKVAAEYERSDEQAAKKLKGAWDVK
jgi:hypothetical protein